MSEILKQLGDRFNEIIESKEEYLGITGLMLNKPPQIDPNKPTVIYLLGSSGVGKDTLKEIVISRGYASFAMSSTNRPQRTAPDGNPDSNDKYVWMDAIQPNETEAEYVQRLIGQYGLIEITKNNQYYYGMPISSLVSREGVPTIIINSMPAYLESSSVITKGFNIVSIYIMPESIKQLEEQIQGRNNPEQRLQEALSGVEVSEEHVHFFLINKPAAIGSEPQAADSLVELIESMISEI